MVASVELLRVAAEGEVGGDEREFGLVDLRCGCGAVVGTVVDEGLVPVDLQVGDDADALRVGGEFVGEVDDDGARKAGGEAHVVDDALPCAVGELRFDVGRDGREAGLPRGVHGAGGEVFDEAVQEEMQRARGRPWAEVEREGVLVGEAREGEVGEVLDVGVVDGAELGERVVAVVVPCGFGRVGCGADDGLRFGEGRLAEEAFVGIDLGSGGMVDGDEADLIDVVDLFHRLAEAEAEPACAGLQLCAVDLDPLVGVGRVALDGRDPVADDARSDDVGDEGELLAVPREEGGAGAAATVELAELQALGGGDVDLVLRDAGGPEEAHEVGLVGAAESGDEVLWRGDLPLLPHVVGEDFDLGAEGALVVGESFERDAQGVILAAAFVVEDGGCAVLLGDDEVGGSVAVDVCGEQGAGGF